VSTQHDRAATPYLRHSAPTRDMQAQSSPSPQAIEAARNLIFGAAREVAEYAASYAASIGEAAYRGDETTFTVHIGQLRSCFVELTKLRDELKAQPI
jgi:hypothetical protein